MSVPAEQLPAEMTLAELLHGYVEAPELTVAGISSDSRNLQDGDLFLACQGLTSHGIDYIDDAIAAGVVAVAYDSSTTQLPERQFAVPVLPIENLHKHLGNIANRFFAAPTASVRVIGVTGTNGKTTVAWLIAQCLERLGESCAYIGTLGSGMVQVELHEGMTTPATIDMHRQLAEFRDQGARFAAVEVSSHALEQNRVDSVAFDSVLFTNLSRDHLDYHGDMQSYADAKARLFFEYSAKQRIINLDSEYGEKLAERCGPDVITVSTDPARIPGIRPFVFVRSVVANDAGSMVNVHSSWGDSEFLLPLPGEFNVENALIALALLLHQGVPMEKACAVLELVDAPPGRMQRIAGDNSRPAVYVDYAHTPEALQVVLHALREHCSGKLWCVFGCGGDRDQGKRPQMGAVVEEYADVAIVTNDNPRNEAPDNIIAGILGGVQNPDEVTVIEDRAAAIAWAIANADDQDVVLIAGKGHENYQIIGTDRRDFSDAGCAIANLEYRNGAQS
ncbi:MAG: UDP-N-acetylmuramoyl-L-alanyl-D-glutamate--2,6-diaminopimelate ligase [Woeseiaceae bacterium]